MVIKTTTQTAGYQPTLVLWKHAPDSPSCSALRRTGTHAWTEHYALKLQQESAAPSGCGVTRPATRILGLPPGTSVRVLHLHERVCHCCGLRQQIAS